MTTDARRVLLTGGTGFVGSHVAEAFSRAGWRLRCTVRVTSRTEWLDPLEPARVGLDLYTATSDEVRAAVQGAEVVVHAAGLTRARDRAEYLRVNADGTERLARAAAQEGVSRFILVSSLAARGPDGAPGPVSDYGRSKREAEKRLRAWAPADAREGSMSSAGPMEAVVLRPAGVYGPRDTDLLPLFRMAARGLLAAPRGAAPLQPVHAADVAAACVRAASAERPGFGPWDVAEEGRYGWDQVAELLGRALGRSVRRLALPSFAFEGAALASVLGGRLLGRAPLLDRRRARDLARHSWTCDPEPTSEALGWRPETPLAEGLAGTAAWYRMAGWLPA